jgi:Zn-dependent protease with chaperone function
MYTGLQHFHSFMAYLVLLGLIVSIVFAFMGMSGNKPFTDKDRKRGLLGLIPAHLQWVIGAILYFISPKGIDWATQGFMKVSEQRFYVLEHPLTMIIAVVLITVGYARSKRLRDDKKRFSSIAIFYTIALILILARIPWGEWPGN